MPELAPGDIRLLKKDAMLVAIQPAVDGDMFQLCLVIERADGKGITYEATGTVKHMSKDRTSCQLQVKVAGYPDLTIPIPHEPGQRKPGIMRMTFVSNENVLPMIMEASMHVDTFTATSVGPQARQMPEGWAARFTEDCGVQLVPNAAARTHHVGRTPVASVLETHDLLRTVLRGFHEEQAKGPHFTGLLQTLLDKWTMARIRHAGGSVDVFSQALESGQPIDRPAKFEEACNKKYVPKK